MRSSALFSPKALFPSPPDFNPYLGSHAKSGILVESSAPQGVGGALTGTIVERRVATREGCVRVVKQLSMEWDERLWYRGQDDADDPLTPGFYRYPNLTGEEGELRYRFQQAARQLVTSEPKNKWEWYFLMQHHGIPTRLLDW